MADGYTPTMEKLRMAWIASRWESAGQLRPEGSDDEFDRAIAAHDAEKRAEWEAARPAEQGEVEWEYVVCGYRGRGLYLAPTLEVALEGIAQDRARSGMNPKRMIKRRRKAGPWVPVNENEATDRENRSEGDER